MKTLLVTPAYALVILALAAACGSKPSPPGRLENVGGSSGREPDASASGGNSGGDSAPVIDGGLPDAAGAPDGGELDAGPDAGATEADAAPDADVTTSCGDGPGGPGNGGPGPGPGGPGNGADPSEECVYIND